MKRWALMFVALVAFWSAAPLRAHAATTTTDPTTTTSAPTTTTLDPNGSSSPTITIPTHSAVDPIDKPVVVDAPSGGSNGSGTIVINTPTGTSNAVLLVLLVTLVAILPGLLLLTTTFPRFLIVLGLTRQGLGLNSTPPNQVLAGLAAFLTLFVMAPTFGKINEVAIQPAMHGQITQGEAIKRGWEPMRDFMLDHARTSDLSMLYDLTHTPKPADKTEISPRFLIPAFILSELRAAFMIGFLIWVPFLLIDLIVSTVLASLGMLMMPPVVVSLPVKLALFVLVDGWALLAGSLLRSAGVG
ncbi:MAG: flagellar type III secretion system pore protein FliP [Ilumatobacteraceae bacterium]